MILDMWHDNNKFYFCFEIHILHNDILIIFYTIIKTAPKRNSTTYVYRQNK